MKMKKGWRGTGVKTDPNRTDPDRTEQNRMHLWVRERRRSRLISMPLPSSNSIITPCSFLPLLLVYASLIRIFSQLQPSLFFSFVHFSCYVLSQVINYSHAQLTTNGLFVCSLFSLTHPLFLVLSRECITWQHRETCITWQHRETYITWQHRKR